MTTAAACRTKWEAENPPAAIAARAAGLVVEIDGAAVIELREHGVPGGLSVAAAAARAGISVAELEGWERGEFPARFDRFVRYLFTYHTDGGVEGLLQSLDVCLRLEDVAEDHQVGDDVDQEHDGEATALVTGAAS